MVPSRRLAASTLYGRIAAVIVKHCTNAYCSRRSTKAATALRKALQESAIVFEDALVTPEFFYRDVLPVHLSMNLRWYGKTMCTLRKMLQGPTASMQHTTSATEPVDNFITCGFCAAELLPATDPLVMFMLCITCEASPLTASVNRNQYYSIPTIEPNRMIKNENL